MNEEKTRELIKESLLKTSDGFTDKLMEKVERQHTQAKSAKVHFFLTCMTCIILFFLLSKFSFDISLLSVKLRLSSTAIKVIGTAIICVTSYKLLILKGELSKSAKN
jgi:uncharacterized protein YacL